MLIYHPALDPYHSAFRMLRIMERSGHEQHTWDQLRVLDFYLTFPELISEIRVPQGQVRRKNQFRAYENIYHFSGSSKLVFQQMTSLQDAALRLLISADIVERITGDVVSLNRDNIPKSLLLRIHDANNEDVNTVEFIVSILGSLPVYGAGGLKDRTGLMEHKYDPV